jgi:membrane-associated protease RseP (regulator of RpoE activity)
MFSVWLAFLNLIPIPGLDGGHVLFTLYEMIVGKPVPQKYWKMLRWWELSSFRLNAIDFRK